MRSFITYTLLRIFRMIMSRMRCEGHVSPMGEKRNAYRIVVEELGTRPL
jgi:hypothetical protein